MHLDISSTDLPEYSVASAPDSRISDMDFAQPDIITTAKAPTNIRMMIPH